LRLTQPTVSPNFSDGGTISDLVRDLRAGLRPDDVRGGPLRVVIQDGKAWSYDNRRLVAFNLADVRDVPIQVMDLRADPVFRAKFVDRLNPIRGEGQQVVIAKSTEQKAAQQLLHRLGLTNRP
jgi:hypothetical protein